jgi:hypothetical protein
MTNPGWPFKKTIGNLRCGNSFVLMYLMDQNDRKKEVAWRMGAPRSEVAPEHRSNDAEWGKHVGSEFEYSGQNGGSLSGPDGSLRLASRSSLAF